MARAPNAQAVASERLVATLADAGVEHVVLSPGSRSTPLVLALAGESRLRIHEVMDERAAGFYALGIARATGAPSVLICTSGSAPHHYAPAVAEADVAGLPLVVISTNRPATLERSGESQTVDQTKLFGDRVRAFFDLGLPEDGLEYLLSLNRRVAQAVARTRHPEPGPAHLDVRFERPLEPSEDGELARRCREAGQSLAARPAPRFAQPEVRVPDAEVTLLARRLRAASRPLVVVGPRHPRDGDVGDALASLVARGVPVAVDAASQLRFHPWAPRFLPGLELLSRVAEPPDFVLRIGRQPVSGRALPFVGAAESVCIDSHAYLDPSQRTDTLLFGDVKDALTRLSAAVGECQAAYAESLARHVERVARIVEDVRRELPSEEVECALAALDALPEGGRLWLGNSLPIRHVDAYQRGVARRLEVHAQRGASGIDGALAAMAGVQVASPREALALIGDVTFAHDVGSLALLRRVCVRTTLVVLDNGGGRIFDRLPVAAHPGAPMAWFHMAPSLDVSGIAAAFGLAARAVRTTAELRAALAAPRAAEGVEVLHVRLDADAGAQFGAAVAARLDAGRTT